MRETVSADAQPQVLHTTPEETAICVEALGRAGKGCERLAGLKVLGLFLVVTGMGSGMGDVVHAHDGGGGPEHHAAVRREVRGTNGTKRKAEDEGKDGEAAFADVVAGAVAKVVEAGMERIDVKLEAVAAGNFALRKENEELRTAKKRLEKMLADGTFAFTRKVDATSFKVLCAILGEGDVAKAARSLGMADSTLRDFLRGWRGRGKEYRAMLDFVRWRKEVGRRESVPINDNVLLQKASNTDYPALLSEVLDGLLLMTDENWPELCEDLAERLRPALMGG